MDLQIKFPREVWLINFHTDWLPVGPESSHLQVSLFSPGGKIYMESHIIMRRQLDEYRQSQIIRGSERAVCTQGWSEALSW